MMRHYLNIVDGDHPWSLMGGLIPVVFSLCRRTGKKYFEDQFGRNCCMLYILVKLVEALVGNVVVGLCVVISVALWNEEVVKFCSTVGVGFFL